MAKRAAGEGSVYKRGKRWVGQVGSDDNRDMKYFDFSLRNTLVNGTPQREWRKRIAYCWNGLSNGLQDCRARGNKHNSKLRSSP